MDEWLSRSRSLLTVPSTVCYLVDTNNVIISSVADIPIYAGQNTDVGKATISIVNGNTLRVAIVMSGSYVVDSGDEPKYEW